GIALIDSLPGHIYEVNPKFAQIAGRTLEEMLSIDWMSITHPDDVQEDLDNMTLLNAGKINGFNMEKRYILPDGSFVWIDMKITPLKAENETQPCHLCMIQDITAGKKAEEALKSSEERLRTIFNAAKNVSLIITDAQDPEPKVMEFSPGAERMFGYSSKEVRKCT
ncbi:MAG: PAS domain S-box protein, partial [Deltaproteobacteria bacterium]|nr:PAS domain S-box protein [Candidatus Desulfobacula maris]